MPKHVPQYQYEESLPVSASEGDLVLWQGYVWEWYEGEWFQYEYAPASYVASYTASVDPVAYLNPYGGVAVLLDDDIEIGLSYGPGVAPVQITQDGVGGHVVTFDSSIMFAGGAPPTLTTVAGATDFLFFVSADSGETGWCLVSVTLDVSGAGS